MEIENDYLARIFDGDQIYVFQSKEDVNEYIIDESSPKSSQLSEPKTELSPSVEEKDPISKEVVILVNEALGATEKETLHKLLRAINIEDGQFEIINDHPEQLKSVQHLKLFLSFHNQYVRSSEYSLIKINKGNAIYAHEIAELNRDTKKKLMLWNLLKKIV